MRPGLAPRCRRTNPPGRSPSYHCGEGLCSAAGVSPVTPRAYSGTANAPDPRRGAGRTLDLLSRDPTGLGGGARPVDRHPRHCNSMAAVPARAGARQALLQPLQHCEARWERTPFYLLLCPVQANVSTSLKAYQGMSPPSAALLPSNRHCSGTRQAIMAISLRRSSGRPPTLQRSTTCSPM
jgi:hypothetical protein